MNINSFSPNFTSTFIVKNPNKKVCKDIKAAIKADPEVRGTRAVDGENWSVIEPTWICMVTHPVPKTQEERDTAYNYKKDRKRGSSLSDLASDPEIAALLERAKPALKRAKSKGVIFKDEPTKDTAGPEEDRTTDILDGRIKAILRRARLDKSDYIYHRQYNGTPNMEMMGESDE